MLVADDPAAVIDVPHFCNEQNYRLLEIAQSDNGPRHYFIQIPQS